MKMKRKQSPDKKRKREQGNSDDESKRSQRQGEGQTSADNYSTSQPLQTDGIRLNQSLSMNLALAVKALSSRVLPRWSGELWKSKFPNPAPRRPPVSNLKRVCSKPPHRTSITAAKRLPACCQIPLRPDLAQIKHLLKQEITWRDKSVRPTTSMSLTPQPAPGPSFLEPGPSRTPAGPSQANNGSESVAHTVRSLQLCSSSSDSSPSPSSDTLPYRRTAPSFRTRRYWNQLEWYKTLRHEKKLRQYKRILDHLYQQNRKSAGEAPLSGLAEADGPCGSQEGWPLDLDLAFQRTKRKRSPRSERALAKVTHIPHKTTRSSWCRKLDSSSSDSPSPPSTSAMATPDTRRPAVPQASPGPSGLSHCVDLDLFYGDSSSPLTKTMPHKGTHYQRDNQTPGISSSVKTASTEVKATRNNGGFGSPSITTTPRKGMQYQRESQIPGKANSVKAASTEERGMRANGDFGPSLKKTPHKGINNENESQSSGITSSLKAKKSVVKTVRTDVSSPSIKTTPHRHSVRGSQTPSTSKSGTQASNSTEVRALSTEAKTKTLCKSNNSKELKLKTKGAFYKSKSLVPPSQKPKTLKMKQNPLPDTPRPKRAEDPGLSCKVQHHSAVRGNSLLASEFTTSSSSSSLQYPKTQQKIDKKKDKSSSTCSHTNCFVPGAKSVENLKVKKPKPFSSNADSKSLLEECKSLSKMSMEGHVTQACDEEKEPPFKQAQLATHADKAQASDRPSTGSALQEESPSPAKSAPEHKKEPWSKKKYLLEKSAMESKDTVIQSTPKLLTTVKLPSRDDVSISSGDATVSQTQVGPFQATKPLTLCESRNPVHASLVNHEASNPGQSSASKSECCVSKQKPPEIKSCSSPPDCFLKPDQPGPKSSILCKNPARFYTTPTPTNSSSRSRSSGSNSSMAGPGRGPAQIQDSQLSAGTSVTLLGASSKGAPQGCTSGHGYPAPISSAVMRAATSQDSAAQATSDGSRPHPEGVLNQGSNERENDEEENRGGCPANVQGHAHLLTAPVPSLISERQRVITDLRALSSMMSLQICPAPSTATHHLQPPPVHPPNICTSQRQPPQVYYHIPTPLFPRQLALLPGLRPFTSRAELTPVLTLHHTVFPRPPTRHSEGP